MAVKIEVEGKSFGDIQESIAIIAQAFNVRVFPPVEESMRKADMQSVVEAFKALMAEQGITVQFDAIINPQADEENVINIDKKARRAKSAASALTSDVNQQDWELIKSETIKRIKEIYFRPGGEEQINKILKKYGGGAKNFQDVDASKFGPIQEAVNALGD